MKAKAATILFSLFIIQLLASCCRDVKYFDFSEVSITTSSNFLALNDTLIVSLSALDLEYISSTSSELGYTSSFATSCDDGWGGMKFPIERIEITSNSDFDEDHLAGKLLNDLFHIKTFNGSPDFEIGQVQLDQPISTSELEFRLAVNPFLSLTHSFSFKLLKSNEDEIIVTSDEITWQ